MEPYELTLTEAADALASRELSPVELSESCLARIDACEDRVSAMVTVTGESALARARQAQDEIARGEHRGPLHGIPYGAKDLYNAKGVPATSSSKVRADHVPDHDSAAVERLDAAGMVMLGKTHTHEFAFGGITPESRNPWDTARVAGGSSGGSAAGVAAGYFPAATGTDTAGSVRIPAAICGVVGLKPTYGRTSRFGVASLSWSLDHVGPLTRSVRDAALVLNALSGHDPRDVGSVRTEPQDFTDGLGDGVEGLRVGVPENYFGDNVRPEIADATAAAVRALEAAGARVVPITAPLADRYKAVEWTLMMAEASAYHRETMRSAYDLYTDDVRAFLEAGETILATDYIDAHRHRTLIRGAWQEVFADVDLVVTATTPAAAVPADDLMVHWPDGSVEHATETYTRLCMPMNLTGLPALTLPSGRDGDGLPLGVQLIGRAFDEATVLRAAVHVEQELGRLGVAAL